MAKDPKFNVEDIERLFRALVPSGGTDPFGKIEEMVLSLAEEHAKEGLTTDQYREQVFERLDSIESRTFGILFLQIFKTLKFFFGLLPQGRIILIVLAAITLLTALLQDGEVSIGSIREAVAKTGLADFIEKLLEELTAFVKEIADHIEELANQTSEVFVSVAGNLDQSLANLTVLANDLIPAPTDQALDLELRMATVQQGLLAEVRRMAPTSNLAANGADLIGPALRAIDERVREIPGVALKLVRL